MTHCSPWLNEQIVPKYLYSWCASLIVRLEQVNDWNMSALYSAPQSIHGLDFGTVAIATRCSGLRSVWQE